MVVVVVDEAVEVTPALVSVAVAMLLLLIAICLLLPPTSLFFFCMTRKLSMIMITIKKMKQAMAPFEKSEKKCTVISQ